ncbi:hypothetical protein ACLOJK_032875 [Asimina triloba]
MWAVEKSSFLIFRRLRRRWQTPNHSSDGGTWALVSNVRWALSTDISALMGDECCLIPKNERGDENRERVEFYELTKKPWFHLNAKVVCAGSINNDADFLVSATQAGRHTVSLGEHEVSFSLNLFPNGFSIGKPAEGLLLPLLQDVPKLLHPYDRSSETLLSVSVNLAVWNDLALQAVEYGWLPGDILDDIPCKYIDGTIVCEVWDYRNCIPKTGTAVSSGNKFPVVQRVCLRMCTENVVKDMLSVSNDCWTYSDLLEVESRIVKAIQPEIFLDPTPSLDRLCRTPVSKKLDLGICNRRWRKRKSEEPAAILIPSNLSYSTNIKRNGMLDNASLHAQVLDGSTPCTKRISSVTPEIQHCSVAQEALKHSLQMASVPNHQMAVSSRLISTNPIPEQEVTDSYCDLRNRGTNLKKWDEYQAQLDTNSGILKKPKQEQFVMAQQQLSGVPMGTHGDDIQWKGTQQQLEAERIRFAGIGGTKHPQLMMSDSQLAVLEGIPKMDVGRLSYSDQRGPQYCTKDEHMETSEIEKAETGKNRDVHHAVSIRNEQSNLLQPQMLLQSPVMRAHFPPPVQWNNPVQQIEKDVKRDDITPKRKSLQSHRVHSAGSVQAPVATSRSGESSGLSVQPAYATCQQPSVVGSNKEKTALMPGHVRGTAAVNSAHNDSLPRENPATLPIKRKSGSLPKTPNLSGVGSSANVNNVHSPFSANSPLVGTSPAPPPSGPRGDPAVLERFSKIEKLSQRYQLGHKEHKVHQCLEKKHGLADPRLPALLLSQPEDADGFRDPAGRLPMSRSLVGGSINICKMRTLIFVRSRRAYQGNGIPVIVRDSKSLLMFERPKDHMVELRIKYGDSENDPQYELPMLATAHHADLLAAQFASLMARLEGFQLTNDDVRRCSHSIDGASSSQSVFPGALAWSGPAELPHPTSISGQLMNAAAPLSSSIPTQGSQQLAQTLTRTRVLSPDNLQALQMSSSYLHRPHQPDSAAHLVAMQQQAQNPQIQRNLPPIGNNLLGSMNVQMGNQVINMHLQLQQQRQLQQRKTMAGGLEPPMGMGMGMGMGNTAMVQSINGSQGLGNIAGLGSMSSVVGMNGLGGSISASTGRHVPGMCNLSQVGNLNHFSNLSQQLRAGGTSPAQAAALAKIRMQQARGRGLLSGGPTRNSMDSVGGMVGSGLVHSGCMLSQTISRSVMAQLQRGGMTHMGPPMVSSIINQQQQLLALHQTGSPLQQMSSPLLSPQLSGLPEQAGSPMAHPSPQQVSQQVPMSPQQLSSGAGPQQQMSAGNVGAGPGSPQLSSQTLGSVGSITSSPMELPGAAKYSATVSNGMVGGD